MAEKTGKSLEDRSKNQTSDNRTLLDVVSGLEKGESWVSPISKAGTHSGHHGPADALKTLIPRENRYFQEKRDQLGGF